MPSSIDNNLPDSLVRVFVFISENAEQEDERKIWRGFGRDLARELSMHPNVISQQMTKLTALGCIRRIKHGTRGFPSIYHIIKAPESEEYQKWREKYWLHGEVPHISRKDRIIDSLNNHAKRIQALEDRLEILENGNNL